MELNDCLNIHHHAVYTLSVLKCLIKKPAKGRDFVIFIVPCFYKASCLVGYFMLSLLLQIAGKEPSV